jgi:hypothetical protein
VAQVITHYLTVALVLAVILVSGAWLVGQLPNILPVLRLKMLEAVPHRMKNWRHKPRALIQYVFLIAGLGVISELQAIHLRPDPRGTVMVEKWLDDSHFELISHRIVKNHGVISRRVVTTAGVAALANAFLNTFEPEIFNYHASGTGTNAEAIGDTALQTETGTRVAGTQSSPAGGQYRTVATVSYGSTLAITEHGILSQLSVGGTLWDRSVFTAINVVNGDSIQFTYTLTINSGG